MSKLEEYVKKVDRNMVEIKEQLSKLVDNNVKEALQPMNQQIFNIEPIKHNVQKVKNYIVDGCKKILNTFKHIGVIALNKFISSLKIKAVLQEIQKNSETRIDACNQSLAKIENFSREYHKSGRALKNMVLIAIGKDAVEESKESGKLAQAVSRPYQKLKGNMEHMRNRAIKMITSIEYLEQSAKESKELLKIRSSKENPNCNLQKRIDKWDEQVHVNAKTKETKGLVKARKKMVIE